MVGNFKTISSLIIICITLLTLIFTNIFVPKIKIKSISFSTFWIVPLIGAIFLICFKDVSVKNVLSYLLSNNSINPIKVIILFFSMTFLSIFLDEIGFFSYLAYIVSKKIGSNQLKLFLALYILISLLTVFTSNDIIILTFTPFICHFAKHCKVNPIPYLMMEFIAANTMSMCLLIGNPTNIYLTQTFNINFVDYFLKMIFPTIASSIVAFVILYLIFRKQLKNNLNSSIEKEEKPNTFLLIIGLSILIITTICLVISNFINIPIWIIAFFGMLIELFFINIYSIIKKTKMLPNVLKHLPFNLIPFILSMFVIVVSLNETGFTTIFSDFLNKINPIFGYGISGAITANLINNIPMSVFYSFVLDGTNINGIYASIIASNIAAYITPLGALAGLMFVSLVKKHDNKFTFLDFTKYGVITGIPVLLVALFVLFIFSK